MDYLTYDTKGIWRFYEIKVSKSDFYSKANKTFLGHFNYYVMPKELYEQVKNEIPSGIGVYVNGSCVKKSKKRKLGIDEQILKDSMIRSLYREAERLIRSKNPSEIQQVEKWKNYYKKERDEFKKLYQDLHRRVVMKYGHRWEK